MASNSNTPQLPTTPSLSGLSVDFTTDRDEGRYVDTTPGLHDLPSLPRRSHSDRAVLPAISNRSSLTPRVDHDRPPLPQFHMSPEDRRRSMVAIDRKRRLTSTSHEIGRRRNVSGGFSSGSRGAQRPDQPPPRPQHSTRDTSARSHTEVIDLTGSSPEHRPPMPTRSIHSSSDRTRYVVPRWQPNEEAVECPICHRPFSFLFRRHHCRKCGRVVCDACSPHRITIPRQRIVHPPGTDSESVVPPPDSMFHQNWTVGEKVRLCNPCVPDPQPEQQLPHHRSQNSFIFGPQAHTQHVPGAYPSFLPHASHRPNHVPPATFDRPLAGRGSEPQPYSPYFRTPYANRFPYAPASEDDDDVSGSSPEQAQRLAPGSDLPVSNLDPARSGHSRFHSLNGPIYSLPPGRELFPQPAFSSSHARHLTGHSSQFAHILNNPARSAEAQIAAASAAQSQFGQSPRRRLKEDDICPVCRRALPDRGPEGDTSAREQHIMDCIAVHTGSASAAAETVVGNEGTGRPGSTVSQALPVTTSAISTSLPAPPLYRPAQLPPGARPVPGSVPGPGQEIAPTFAASSSSTPRHLYHQPGMVRFIATEKDCIADSDDNPPECSICMVEYEPGDRLIRLECWCKFHQECIVQWVVGRGGSCPVHKIGN